MNRKGKVTLATFVLVFIASILLLSFVFAAPKVSTQSVAQCKDGIDNDGDGYTDWPSDPGCQNKNDLTETNSAIECDDGIDNDGDGNVDMADSGCSSPTDSDETNCGDGVCEGGETSGSCLADCGEPDSCFDDDNGFYPFIFGTTSGYLNNLFYSHDDYCVDSGTIMEYSCSGNYEQNFQVSCGNDTYGMSYCISNYIYHNLTDYFCSLGACSFDITPVMQENCDSYDGYGSNYCSSNLVYKDYNNYFCSTGACDYSATPELVENCDSYDGYTSNYCVNDSVYKDYNNYFCSTGACDYSAIPVFVEDCWDGCTDGECNGISNSCSGTDGLYENWVPDVFGTISGYFEGEPYSYDDYCLNSTVLREYVCTGTNYVEGDYWDTNCVMMNYTSCFNGACI